jgi:hypothetical protein
MGAYWLAQRLAGSARTRDIVVKNDRVLTGAFQDAKSGDWGSEIVYVPPRADYVVTFSTIEDANALDATMIVGDAWTNIVNETVSHKGSKIRLFQASSFLREFGA